jgi:alanyl-tRNA synthetase
VDTRNIFLSFVDENGFQMVDRSNLVSKYFKNEFNLSGGHSHLVPAILSSERVEKKDISVVDLCIRKTDAGIIGISNNHLLLFEMGVWGSFGYIDNKKQEESRHLSLLLQFLKRCDINLEMLYFTICAGGQYIGKEFLPDDDSYDILLSLGINSTHIFKTTGRRNFMLSRGIDRFAGYNIEVFVKRGELFVEVASSNIYQYINKLTHLERTVNTGIGCGVGIERIEFISKGCQSIYDLDFFKNTKDKIGEILQIPYYSVNIISDKVYRIIELSKTVIFLINDRQGIDKTAQGKTMRSYLAKITSEVSFLSIPLKDLFKIIKIEMDECFSERYSIRDESYNIFFNALAEQLEK